MGGHNEFPYEFKELEPEEKKKLARFYASQPDFVSVGPKGYKLLRPYCDDAENIYNMPVQPTDTFVITYQRSGTTWAQELVWLLANDLDYITANKISLSKRFNFLELFMFYNKQWQDNYLKTTENEEVAQAVIDHLTTPGTVKLSTVPADKVTYTPYFEHVKEAWEQRNHPNMLFLFYEELSKDLPSVVRRVADFLGKVLTPEQVSQLSDHLSFANFKNNAAVNYVDIRELGILAHQETFIRKGKAGGWREYFDEEMIQQANQWFAENLRDTDLRFPDT